MNPQRARKQIVAYAIMSFLAFCTAVLGLALAYSAWTDRHFLLYGDRAALDVCLNNPVLDCDPRPWKVLLIVGAVLLTSGFALLLYLGNKLRRLMRARSR